MSLNIKNEEAHKLAGLLSELTGESMTQAVIGAIRERIARLQKPDNLADELLAIGRDCAKRMSKRTKSIDHGTLLYDDKGLPK